MPHWEGYTSRDAVSCWADLRTKSQFADLGMLWMGHCGWVTVMMGVYSVSMYR